MIIDALTVPAETLLETDICIIGAGAAGITIARELSNQPYEVCILESGGLGYEPATQSLYEGDNVGTRYFPLKEARARYLGGSTNLWGGWSRPLDEIDFEQRSWMPYSGWPITKSELDPYYHRAQQACHLGPFEYDLAYWQAGLAQLQMEIPSLGEEITTHLWQVIPSTHVRFGEAYRTELEQARNIKTYLHANVIEIETNDTARAVTRLRVASIDGKQFCVKAKTYILAVGGIENPRLLLLSNKDQTCGLGNQYDLVGRFFMEHPILWSGKVSYFNQVAPPYIEVDNTFMGTGFGLSKQMQEREQVLNFSLRVKPIVEEWLLALKRLQYKMRQSKASQELTAIVEGHEYEFGLPKKETSAIEDLGQVIANSDRVLAKAYAKLFRKPTEQSVVYRTHLISEQAPNPDSRITLSTERDCLGLNRVNLDWRLSPIDKYTVKRSQQVIAQKFEQFALGQMQIELTDDDASWQSIKGSYHHIGTTRMSTNPRQGVVNEHCQVHGVSNLYVAGSSVFPTSGLSNPTLTIVALAIRLADEIKQQMKDTPTVKARTTSTTLAA
ncbi:GMC family oxidoreductase [Gloeocapsopsis crepidinum LEGE 06123]|uniref:GMC family oxidoreductase n=1 Tax=Gloeocapsopsis crepidinum LEGE 06123 TaxID=588587 RepID=A0ABR9UR35_9CHRO|nr:GMC family oxidoreductase [Gloeocapsopsis crepidinum]MBE9190513.1 GMC family oxidoreductase [Gloeocapsopsis crepidinum LEGE 06123]